MTVRSESLGGDGSVLIVDDDAMTRMLYSQYLRGRGFDVVSVSSGSAALSQLCARTFDLVLLDNFMPNLNGIELLEELPLYDLAGKPRIVMMSASADPSVAKRCKALGVEEVLVKPVRPATLRSLAQRAAETRPS